jgi:hypothetical protein
VTLEEVDGDSLVVRIAATPARPSDGPRLAGEVLSTVTANMVSRYDVPSAAGHRLSEVDPGTRP